MTNELSNEEKARIFAMYLGCEVYTPLIKEIEKNIGVIYHENNWCLLTDKCDRNEFAYLPNYYLKLIPLDKINDEDALELSKVLLPDKLYDYLHGSPTGNAIAKTISNGRQTNTFYPHARMYDAFQFLISRHYAVPLWPWNKTAIELGAAIDATIDMQEYLNNHTQ